MNNRLMGSAQRRRLLVLSIAAAMSVAVVACTGGSGDPELGEAAAATPEPGAEITPVEGYAVIERFETDGALTTTPGKFSWSSSAGGWIVLDGVLRIQRDGEEPRVDVAVARLGTTQGLVQVTMPVVVNEAGLVFRYEGPDNYWAVLGAPAYVSWNLVKVVDGEATIVGNTGLAPIDPFTTVGVLLADTQITVMVNGRPTLVADDPDLAASERAGVYASGPEAGDARWDEFTVIGVGVDALPTPKPLRLELPTPTPEPG